MIEEFSNPTLLEEHVDQENFVDILCKNYTNEQTIENLYKNLELVNIILEEFSNPTLLEEQVD